MKLPQYSKQKGFTVVELLITAIVIAILVISLIAMLQRVNMRSRDAIRLTDMANLYQAIQIAVTSNEDSEKLYFILCSQIKTPCEGTSYPTGTNTRKIDGSGWLKVLFTKKTLVKYSILPVDPINNEQYNYHYFSDGKSWKIETKLESDKMKSKMNEDGGTDPEKYELTQKLK